ncbi:MAG: PAS domain-containing protein [Methylocystis sp.]|nr:MAG: PAS domain-containing protein [Methylocystis sp.]
MRQQISKDLYAYWSDLKGARAAPDRADIDPRAIRHILADTFIIEVDSDCAFPLRLSGTRLDALWRRERKGDSFVDLWREFDQPSIASALLTVIEGVTPVVAGAKAVPPGEDALELELLLLPLRHFGKTHSRVLGALSPVYQPDWLGRVGAGPLELISLRVISARSVEPTTYRPQPFQAGGMTRPRPRLVVYHGDKQ